MEQRGRIINNRYQLIDILGKGGMSTVYYAKDLTLPEKLWAIKRISYSEAKDEKSKRQLVAFEKEVELLTTLNHPDIPRIVDRIHVDDELYVCMDLINGVSLLEEFNQHGIFKEEKIIDLTIKLCDILIYLHEVRENPIIYRDIKLENVMLVGNRVKLVDFGIAKECKRGVNIIDKLGTRGYAAPEQYLGLSLDERTDIYALGSMLYRLATGIVPKGHPHQFPNLRHSNQNCSEELEYIIHKCIKEKPDDRYKNCHELKKDLLNIDKINIIAPKKIKKGLMKYILSISICIVFIIITTLGYKGIITKLNQDNYSNCLDKALLYQQENQFNLAENQFIEAMKYQPKSIEPYIYILDMYKLKQRNLKELTVGNHEELVKESILTVEDLIQDKSSNVYNNPEIMYHLAKLCLEVESDSSYALKSYNYFERVKESHAYDDTEIENYSKIAHYKQTIFNTEDGYRQLAEALKRLEDYTDEIKDVNTRLDNYYTITTIYNSYLNQEELDSANQIIVIINKALELIADTPEGILEFEDEIILVERIADAYYTKAINETDFELQQSLLEESVSYYAQLEETIGDLSETILIRIGDMARLIVQGEPIKGPVSQKLEEAIYCYESAIIQSNQYLEGTINLIHSYLDLQLRDYYFVEGENTSFYDKAIHLYSTIDLTQDVYDNVLFQDLEQRISEVRSILFTS